LGAPCRIDAQLSNNHQDLVDQPQTHQDESRLRGLLLSPPHVHEYSLPQELFIGLLPVFSDTQLS
jgi:hypothetical protein